MWNQEVGPDLLSSDSGAYRYALLCAAASIACSRYNCAVNVLAVHESGMIISMISSMLSLIVMPTLRVVPLLASSKVVSL